MAYIRFYSPFNAAYGNENSNESYNQLMRNIQSMNDCGCQENIPASNITETEKEYRIEMALPGVDKNNIKIMHEKGHLTVNLEAPVRKEDEAAYTRREFDYSSASRSFKTGDKVDQENIAARYENGVLTISLPKKEAFVSKPSKLIAVE